MFQEASTPTKTETGVKTELWLKKQDLNEIVGLRTVTPLLLTEIIKH